MVSGIHIDTGVKVSGLAHAALIGWMLVGGLFSYDREALEFTDVTVISGEQFAAMMAARSPAPEVADSPAAPAAPEAGADTPAAPEAQDAPRPAEAPEAVATAPAETAPSFDDTFETPQAEVQPVAPPAPTAPEVPDGASMVLAPENPPAPRAAPRVAPQPAERPAPDAEVAPEVREAVRPDPAEAAESPVEAQAPAAPEEAATEIVTEATQPPGGTQVALAPTGTPRPRLRPARPVETAAPAEPAAPAPPAEPRAPAEPEAPAEPQVDDAIAAAVAEAVAAGGPSEAEGTGRAPIGPPLTTGEKDALRIGVERCWNVGALSTDALRTTVTLRVEMNENATPDAGSIRMIESDGGDDAAARQAFEAARRAIIRCGASGFDLPAEKFSHWREIEMVFNPENMRIK